MTIALIEDALAELAGFASSAVFSWDDLLPADVAKQQRVWERRRSIFRMREAGFTLDQIGNRFGIGRARVGQILARAHLDTLSPVEKYQTGGVADLEVLSGVAAKRRKQEIAAARQKRERAAEAAERRYLEAQAIREQKSREETQRYIEQEKARAESHAAYLKAVAEHEKRQFERSEKLRAQRLERALQRRFVWCRLSLENPVLVPEDRDAYLEVLRMLDSGASRKTLVGALMIDLATASDLLIRARTIERFAVLDSEETWLAFIQERGGASA